MLINLKNNMGRAKLCWFVLGSLAGVFACLYLWSAFFPGPIDTAAAEFFSPETAAQARAYSFRPRVLYISRLILQAAFLSYLLFSTKGRQFLNRLLNSNRPYWQIASLSILTIWLLLKVLALPFTYYTGYYWTKIWGISTQSQAAWWTDYLKNAGLEFLLTLLGGLILFWFLQRIKRYWWLVCAFCFSLWLVIESFCWPVLISPLFNSFTPLNDPAVIKIVDELAAQAGLEINEVLVMDAGKRTNLSNAYFSGVGPTKRIVLYDTLLQNYTLPEVQAVLAHEMGHWRHQDILFGLLYGSLGAFFTFGLLALLLKPWSSKNRPQPPQFWVALQLALLLLFFVGNPLQNSISRGMEIKADLYSLELTNDLAAGIELQKKLAGSSLADLSPPPFIVWFSYSHPPALERIKILEGSRNVSD